jgi:hypothetical protein
MFEHLLTIYGISCGKRYVKNFFIGIILTVFSVFLIRISVFKEINYSIGLILFKILCLVMCLSYILSYIFIKVKSKEILELYIRLKTFETDISQNKLKVYYPSIVALNVSIVLTLIYVFLVKNTEILEEFLRYKNIRGIYKCLFITISVFYLHSWKIIIQLINDELNIKFSHIIQNFNNQIQRKLSYPDINVIQMTHRTVLRFIGIQSHIKRNINFAKYFIIIDTISVTVFMILWIIRSISFSDRHLLFTLCKLYNYFLVLYVVGLL